MVAKRSFSLLKVTITHTHTHRLTQCGLSVTLPVSVCGRNEQWLHPPRQVAACRPKCTVSRQTVHLAARMLSPTVKRWAELWCSSRSLWLSF